MNPHLAPTFEVIVERNVRVATAEPDVTLSAVVYRPASQQPVPALVTVLPYRNDAGAGMQHDYCNRWMAARGYACVLVDFRGTGSSDGRARPPFSAEEADDAVATIDWAVEQAWCNGRVGMWGMSYGGLMTMRTAARRPAHLGAIIPILGLVDPGRDFVHPAGVRGNAISIGLWGTQAVVNQLLPPLDDHESAEQQARWRARCNEEPWIIELSSTGPNDPRWRPRAVDPSRIVTPALCVSGWRDLFCDPQIRAFEQMTGPKRLVAGPWMHNLPWDAFFESIDFLTMAKDWWDHWLRDVENGVMDEPPALAYVQGSDPSWRELTAWPPTTESCRLSSDVSTTDAGDMTRPLHSLVPETPGDQAVGPLSGLWWSSVQGFGLPLDQDSDDRRVISFTSDPLETDLTIVGRPDVDLAWVNGETPDRVVVKLTDVGVGGDSLLVTAGVSRPEGADHPNAVELYTTAYRVAAGHRIRVVVSYADFPRLWPTDAARFAAPTKVTLRLPVLDLESTKPALVNPSPVPTAPDTEPANSPRWSITRNCITSSVEIQHGEKTEFATPNGEHTLRVGHLVTATTAPDGRGAQTLTRCWANAALSSGQVVEVLVEATISDASLVVTARVADELVTHVDRRWQAEIPIEGDASGRGQK